MTVDLGQCDCCNKEPAIGVASIPGVPMSITWCKKCLDANVVPYWIAVCNTAMIGGLEGAADWWKKLVFVTLKYFNKSGEEFEKDIQTEIVLMNEGTKT